ncbi:YbaB/EbfC family nucleoid-associated protein [Amycolatopsis rhizosphaerae]|uniref:YbaB/EbfC family nucleoid-associated protein n=1 Tax=Amycolatopsis rhizosphaerae TaxID=2053003 RepID=A0A558DCA7_9PSEU|nr:YbaB/EbfC family nucleoid-associated protein [Amycolatopsis rhizosphaerae]TVT58650.1 YbaB/EbfC family nucleoid-associated protein [Amycolatopsis rhizosphaerae]
MVEFSASSEVSSQAVNPVFQDMLEQLRKTARSIPETQRRMMAVTGVAWSPDRMVKAVVGPRGQLVDLEIDPRVFRRPDAAQLRATILAASTAAVGEVTARMREIMEEQFPPEFAELRDGLLPERTGAAANPYRPDAEIYAERKEQR